MKLGCAAAVQGNKTSPKCVAQTCATTHIGPLDVGYAVLELPRYLRHFTTHKQAHVGCGGWLFQLALQEAQHVAKRRLCCM